MSIFAESGAGHIVTQKYFVPEEIEELLDSIDEKNLFGEIPGEPDDIAPTPDDVNSYTITVDLKSGAHREISGTYDKYGLPAGWRYFVRRMCELVSAYDFTDVLSPSMYDRAKRRKSDIIYCSVEFEEGYKSYYYISDDDSIEPGDRVVVPAGRVTTKRLWRSLRWSISSLKMCLCRLRKLSIFSVSTFRKRSLDLKGQTNVL